MADREKLRALRERIEGGETGRGVDDAILTEMEGWKLYTGKSKSGCLEPGGKYWHERWEIGHYTTKIDAAVALVERMLPREDGWRWHMVSDGTTFIDPPVGSKIPGMGRFIPGHPAAALVCAMLKALEARDDA